MKNVVLVLKNAVTMARFVPVMKKLQNRKIAVQTHLTAERIPAVKDALYITDSTEAAKVLEERKLPVLGFLHQEGDELSEMRYVMEEPEEIDGSYLERIYRRCRGIPWEIANTPRCIIRESIVEDVDAFFLIYQDEEVVKYTDPLLPAVEEEKAYMQEYIRQIYGFYEFGIWTVLSAETGEIIGRAGFAVRDGYEWPDMGFVIASRWRGKGIAYEICTTLLKYGREMYGFERVQALVMPENTASRRLCRKLGFAEEKLVTENGREYLFVVKNLC